MAFIFGGSTGLTYGQLKNLQERVKARRQPANLGHPIASALTNLGADLGDIYSSYRLKKETGERDRRFSEALSGDIGERLFANRAAMSQGQPLPHPEVMADIVKSGLHEGREDFLTKFAPTFWDVPTARKRKAALQKTLAAKKPTLSPEETLFANKLQQEYPNNPRTWVEEAAKQLGDRISPAMAERMNEWVVAANKREADTASKQRSYDFTATENQKDRDHDLMRDFAKSQQDLANSLETQEKRLAANAFIEPFLKHTVPYAIEHQGATMEQLDEYARNKIKEIAGTDNLPDKAPTVIRNNEETERTNPPATAVPLRDPNAVREVKNAVSDIPGLGPRIVRERNPENIKAYLNDLRSTPRMLYHLDKKNIDVWDLDSGNIDIKTVEQRPSKGVRLLRDPSGNIERVVTSIPEAGSEAPTGWKEESKAYDRLVTGEGSLKQVNRSIFNRAQRARDNIFSILEKGGIGLTGAKSLLMANVPQTAAYTLDKNLLTMRSLVTTLALNELRTASPTGGALGQVSNFEGQKLEAALGVLYQSQTEEEFVGGLNDVMEAMEGIVMTSQIISAIRTKDFKSVTGDVLEYANNYKDLNGNKVYDITEWKDSNNNSVNAIRFHRGEIDLSLAADPQILSNVEKGLEILETGAKGKDKEKVEQLRAKYPSLARQQPSEPLPKTKKEKREKAKGILDSIFGQ